MMEQLRAMWDHGFTQRLRKAVRSWQQDDGNILAAAMAYYSALAFFPLLMILTAGMGLVLRFTGWGRDARKRLLDSIATQTSASLSEEISDALNALEANASIGGPIGAVIMLFISVAMFAHFERSFDRIWNKDYRKPRGMRYAMRNALRRRLAAFIMLLATGTLVVVTFVAGVAIDTAAAWGKDVLPIPNVTLWFAHAGVSFVINASMFALIYKALPRVRIRWQEAIRGAMLASVIWELGRQVLGLFLPLSRYSAYGVVGSFIATMLWVYFASCVVFLGAEYVKVTSPNAPPRKYLP